MQFLHKILMYTQAGQVWVWLMYNRQSFTKYLRQTLVFMWDNALREKFNFYFSDFY